MGRNSLNFVLMVCIGGIAGRPWFFPKFRLDRPKADSGVSSLRIEYWFGAQLLLE